jgi:hypothetical protein
MSLINSVNLIILLENKILTKKKRFNVKDEHLSILWKYIFTIFQKYLNDFICYQSKNSMRII